MVTFHRYFEPASATEVAAFEQKQQIILPPDYKQFLLTINGGSPTPNCFLVPDRGPALADFLYGIGTERTSGDLEFEQEQASFHEPLPPGFLVIGHDPGGSQLILATMEEDKGRMYFWDRTWIWVRDDGQNLFPVTTSFTEFLQLLRELPDNESNSAPN